MSNEKESVTESTSSDEAVEEASESIELAETQEVDVETFPVEVQDAGVVVLTWLMTYGAGKLFAKLDMSHMRKALPAVAVVFAVGLSAGFESLSGNALNFSSVVTALGAAGVAVLGHSQVREIFKAMEKGSLQPEE